jgi:hypothetical protein
MKRCSPPSPRPRGRRLILELEVLEGRSVPSFASGGSFAADNSPAAVAQADLNGDSKLDLVVANRGSNDVSVLLGNGDGTFQAPVNYDLPGASPGGKQVVAADLNGDGQLDLVVSTNTGLSLLLGNGDGTFQAPLTYDLPGAGITALAVGDFNGDGWLDLVVANVGHYPGDVEVLLNDGNWA